MMLAQPVAFSWVKDHQTVRISTVFKHKPEVIIANKHQVPFINRAYFKRLALEASTPQVIHKLVSCGKNIFTLFLRT